MSYPNVDHKIAKIVLKREPSPKPLNRSSANQHKNSFLCLRSLKCFVTYAVLRINRANLVFFRTKNWILPLSLSLQG